MKMAIKAGSSELIWLWFAMEPKNKVILALHISIERNMFVADDFCLMLYSSRGIYSVSLDGGTWYPQACKFLKLNHYLILLLKIGIERTMQYIKDRTECFDDYFLAKRTSAN